VVLLEMLILILMLGLYLVMSWWGWIEGLVVLVGQQLDLMDFEDFEDLKLDEQLLRQLV